MRQIKIVTNETCGLRCRFCNARGEHERTSVAGADALRARIDATATDATELVLSGGEPTRRRDLPRIVAYAGARTDARLVLETNAAELRPGLAPELAAAGLHRARVHLPAWGADLDRVCGRHGTGFAVREGIRALADAGIEIEAATPIIADNLDLVSDLPSRVLADGVRPRRWWLRIPWRAPDPSSLAPLAAALDGAARFIDGTRSVGVPAMLDPDAWLPPCLFARPGRIAHVYALNRGAARRDGYRHVPACEACHARERCPGLPHDIDLQPRAPIDDERLRRRLTVISSVEDQVRRELVTHEIYRLPDGTTHPAAIIRVNFHCNQACRFCFVSTHLPPAPDADIDAAIDEIGARLGMVAFSGGEPTLDPRLPDRVRRAKAAGVLEVELQTNAVRLAEPGLAHTLADAGVDVAFVSLHGATAEVSDAITEAPGTHRRTLEGIDRLRAAGIRVRVNFVLCTPNHHEFPAFVELVAQRWPGAAINCSFVAPSTDLVPRTASLVPRYRDVLPSLAAGLREATRLDVEVGGFDSMCGIPLCLVPTDLQPFFALAELPAGYDRGEFLKPAACRQCVLEPRCFGIRRGYAELYGAAELRPVRSRS
jgi:molybdenum cofactor biosynthesis enzyme MoaA